jgi:dienelactone hydrolase
MLYALALVTTVAAADAWLEKPVDDNTFRTYLEFSVVDSELPLDVTVSETDVVEGVIKDHVTYQSSRGEHVPAYFFTTASDDGAPRPGQILLYPGGRKGKWVSLHAPMLVRAGWNVLAIDMKHFDERDTGLMTTFTEADKHEALYNAKPVYLEWVLQTVRDVRRGYDFLVSERNTDPERIVLMGASRGAVAGMIAAAAEERLAAFVSIVGGHFDGLERGHLPAACPANYVGRISPRPVLMINGTHDADFNKDTSVQPIFDLVQEPKTIRWQDQGHSGIGEEGMAFLLDWVRENVK